MVVRGRHSLPFCPLRGQHCRAARFAASAAVTHGRTDTRTRGRTPYNTPLNPPGVGWVNFFYPINVIVSIRTCVPNLGSIRGSVRKNCLLSLIIDDVVRSFVRALLAGRTYGRTPTTERTSSLRTDVGLPGRTGGQTPDGRTAQCEKRSPRPNKINTTIVDTTSIDGSTAIRNTTQTVRAHCSTYTSDRK